MGWVTKLEMSCLGNILEGKCLGRNMSEVGKVLKERNVLIGKCCGSDMFWWGNVKESSFFTPSIFIIHHTKEIDAKSKGIGAETRECFNKNKIKH